MLVCVLNEVVREDFTVKETFEQRSEGGEGMRLTDTREKSIRDSKCRDPETRVTGAK